MIPIDTTATTAATGNYRFDTDCGYVYVASSVRCDSTSNSTAETDPMGMVLRHINPPFIRVTNVLPPTYDIEVSELPAEYPLRVQRLKICPCRTIPLSRPMAECYWQRGPPPEYP